VKISSESPHELLGQLYCLVEEPDLIAHGISSQETVIMSSSESFTNPNIGNYDTSLSKENTDPVFIEIEDSQVPKSNFEMEQKRKVQTEKSQVPTSNFETERKKKVPVEKPKVLKSDFEEEQKIEVPVEKRQVPQSDIEKERKKKVPVEKLQVPTSNFEDKPKKKEPVEKLQVPELDIEKERKKKVPVEKLQVPKLDIETINEVQVQIQKETCKRRIMDNKAKVETKRLKVDINETSDEGSKLDIDTNSPTPGLQMNKKLPQTPSWNPPGQVKNPPNSSSHSSPASGLRLGLSRNRRTSKPLHPAIKSKT